MKTARAWWATNTRGYRGLVGAGLVLLAPATPTAALQHADGGALGTVHLPTSCRPAVQAAFDHAVAQLHHMTYPQARASFERVATEDSTCALAHWGIAMTLFQPAWPNRPDAAARTRGHDEAAQALRLAGTDRERLYAATVAAFFEDPASGDYWARITRWEQASAELHAAYPDDVDATALSALAHLVTPTRGSADTLSAALLLGILANHPDHPGAMHYLIHANDAAGRERHSLEVVRAYETVAPANPHALHMPTHIYVRLGDWPGVIRGNTAAAEAALAHPAGEHGELVWDEYPHAIEYLVYAYLQQGADSAAEALTRRLEQTPHLEPTFKTAFHLASTRARYALERHAWPEAMALVPQPGFWWPEAVTWFARGLGAAHESAPAIAQDAHDRLVALDSAATAAGETLFAQNIRLLRLELEAIRSWRAGRGAEAAALLRRAADDEAAMPKHPVTPAPTLPAHELLGDVLLEQGDGAAALAAYRSALDRYPGRFWSLLGAARAARALGHPALARQYYQTLHESAPGTTRAVAEEIRRQNIN